MYFPRNFLIWFAFSIVFWIIEKNHDKNLLSGFAQNPLEFVFSPQGACSSQPAKLTPIH
jgi:hypothetical protein